MRTIQQIRRVIHKSGADIVHTRNWAAFDGVIAACFCPGVVVLHGEHGRDLSDPQGSNRRRKFFRRLLSPRIRKFTTVSEDLARWLIDEIGISKNKVVLIPNGVDTDRFRPRRDPKLRKELGISEQDFVIGTVGRLDPVKDHARLIKAYADLAKEQRHVRLVIVGDGPERQNLENLIRILEVRPPPLLIGYRDDIERFYGLFDVFVLNSYAEGMSNTLMEAMSSGLPVICTPVGANSEIVVNGERGFIVPVGDTQALIAKLRCYLQSPECRAEHSLAGRRFMIHTCDLSLMTRRYVELYRGAMPF